MKYNIVIFILIFASKFALSQHTSKATSASKGITVSGFTLCGTKLSDLNGFEQVDVEEMDLSKNCYGQDARFSNGVGYFSEQFPGVILQQGNQSDYIGKIRLTKDFNGQLPDGTAIDVGNLKLRNVFNIYPQFKDKWQSRGCSDYWKFSNDTISFYVRIDKSIQPQFPVNETYYADKPVEGIDLVLSCYRASDKPSISIFDEDEPIFFLDSIRINSRVMKFHDPDEIAFASVYKDSTAIKMAGPTGKNGVIYIFTKDFARSKCWHYLKDKSPDFKKAVPSADENFNVIYILNNKVIEKDYESILFDLSDSTFIDVHVIDKETLRRKFKVSDKEWGIVIRTTLTKSK